jgi:PST family polysaccharide transporter
MTQHYRKRLFSNFLALGIVQGTNYLLPILVMPYVLKKIGADGFGEVAVAQVVMMFCTNITDYGFNLTATRDVSMNRNNGTMLSSIFCTVLLTRLLICLALFLVLVLTLFLVPALHPYSTLYLLAFTSVIGQSMLVNWLFQGIERMKFITWLSLFARLVFVVLVFVFIHQKADNIYFIFFTGVGNILAGGASIVVAARLLKLKIFLPPLRDVAHELKEGWHITISNLAVSSYTYINVVVLRLFTDDATVGYYSVAEKLIMAARQVLSVYFQAIYPQVCRLAQTTRQEVVHFFKHYYLPFLGAVAVGCLILFIFPQQIVGFFLNNHVALSAQYLRIMSFVPLIICLNIPPFQLLLAGNEKRRLLRIFIGGITVNLALNMIIVRMWGALGTSLIVVITELLITIALIYEMGIVAGGGWLNTKNNNI